MKIGEMRAMPAAELEKQVSELRAELARERAVAAGGTRPENPGKICGLKKNIARMLTVINEKKRGAMPPGPGAKAETKALAQQKPQAEEKAGPVAKEAEKHAAKSVEVKPKKAEAKGKAGAKAKEQKKRQKGVKRA